jgi:hypothetical protein
VATVAGAEQSSAQPLQLARARASARAFFSAYLPYLYEQAPASAIRNVSPSVRDQLQRARARTTPAEHLASPRVVAVKLSQAGPPTSVRATATYTTAARPRASSLTVTLEPRRGRWLVTALAG